MMNRSFEIDEEGDIILDEVNVNGATVLRPRMIEGTEEVEQAYSLRFATRRGEDRIFPDAGFPIDQVIGLFHEDYISGRARETLLQDPRTANVRSVSVELDHEDRVARIDATISLSNGEVTDFETSTDKEI